MKVELQHITIREVITGYVDDAEEGVEGYDDKQKREAYKKMAFPPKGGRLKRRYV
jgi:hypothetical protein